MRAVRRSGRTTNMVIDVLSAVMRKKAGSPPVIVVIHTSAERSELRQTVASQAVCRHFAMPGSALSQLWDRHVCCFLVSEFTTNFYTKCKSAPFVHHTAWDYRQSYEREELIDALEYVWYKTPESRGL